MGAVLGVLSLRSKKSFLARFLKSCRTFKRMSAIGGILLQKGYLLPDFYSGCAIGISGRLTEGLLLWRSHTTASAGKPLRKKRRPLVP